MIFSESVNAIISETIKQSEVLFDERITKITGSLEARMGSLEARMGSLEEKIDT